MKLKFSKPTVDDIVRYLVEVKNYIESVALEFAERFWWYYESKGWVVGKAPMKDWKAAVRTWELNNKKYGTHQQTNAGDKKGTSASRTEALRNW